MAIYPAPKPKPRVKTPKPLQRKTRLAPINKARRHERFTRAYHSVGFVAWVRSLSCSVPNCRESDIVAAHAVSRAAGGTWGDIFPCCTVHHSLQHTLGIKSFERRFGINTALIAAAVAQRWTQFSGEQGR